MIVLLVAALVLCVASIAWNVVALFLLIQRHNREGLAPVRAPAALRRALTLPDDTDAAPGTTEYVIQHTHAGKRTVLYDGANSDEARAAFLRMERDRAGHPGLQEWIENGVPRVSRQHDEPPV